MLVEDFGARYTEIPFTTFARDYKRNTRTTDIEGLSHLHREMEVLLMLDGAARLHIDRSVIQLTAGDLVIVPPYTLHRYTIAADRDCRHYCACFDPHVLYDKALAAALENGAVTLPRVLRDEVCAACIRAAFLANEQKADGWALQVIGQLSLFFSRLQETGALVGRHDMPPRSIHGEMFAYIATHYTEEITSADAAAVLHLNPSYFCRLFRQNFGERFLPYLCKYRLEKSKTLLRNTALSVSEIALSVGFGSFSYYSKRFREYTGMTPREYRTTKKH